jgi:RNA binding exosome subunit
LEGKASACRVVIHQTEDKEKMEDTINSRWFVAMGFVSYPILASV